MDVLRDNFNMCPFLFWAIDATLHFAGATALWFDPNNTRFAYFLAQLVVWRYLNQSYSIVFRHTLWQFSYS